MQGLQSHTSILDPGGPRVLFAAVGEHARPPRFPLSVPRAGLHSLALLPASKVIRHDDLHLIIVIDRTL